MKTKRLDISLFSDLPLLCLQASMEITQTEERRNYKSTRQLAEILKNESSEKMSPSVISILHNALSKYSPGIKTVDDLQMEVSKLASDLREVKDLPEDRLKDLSGICLELGKAFRFYISNYLPQRHFAYA